jgi:hypothetical protein
VTVLLLLLACSGPDDVEITCVPNWSEGDEAQSDPYVAATMSCDQWAEHGEAQLASEEAACVQDGLFAGFTTSTCTCTANTGSCTFPSGVND